MSNVLETTFFALATLTSFGSIAMFLANLTG